MLPHTSSPSLRRRLALGLPALGLAVVVGAGPAVGMPAADAASATVTPAGAPAASAAAAASAPAVPARPGFATGTARIATAVDTATAEARIARLLPARLSTRTMGSRIGVLVEDAASGRDIVGTRAAQSFMPASNMKLATSVAVLSSLGPDTAFRTTVVRGDGLHEVVLVGGGDPLLTSEDLAALATRVVAARRAGAIPAGRVVVRLDDHLFPAPSAAPGWRSDYQPYTVSPVRALGRVFQYTSDSAASAARYVVERLRAAGLPATYAGRTIAPSGADVLGEVSSHTVRDAVKLMLLVSENNVAELLFRQVALATGHEPSWSGSSAAVAEVLRGLGVPLDGVVIADGSGASRADRLTPETVTALLRLAVSADQPRLRPIYVERGLPVAGLTGTLRASLGRYDTPPSNCARGEVLAKTGTLTGAIALSGVTTGTDGQLKVFSFLVNDPPTSVSALTTRRALDGLAATVHGCW